MLQPVIMTDHLHPPVEFAVPQESEWTPEPFEADDGTVPFERFLDDLSDFKFVTLDTAIRHVLAVRGIEFARTEWLKSLGRGLPEFRVRHEADEIARMFGDDLPGVETPKEKILLRVFVYFYGDKGRAVARRLRQGQGFKGQAPAAGDRPSENAACTVQSAPELEPVVA